MEVGRRETSCSRGLASVPALSPVPRAADAGETDIPQAFSTFGVVPGDGAIYQTATLQAAADAAGARGNGISIESDTVVSGNVIENAPGFGISVGWGGYLRDVSVTDNLIRNAQSASVSPSIAPRAPPSSPTI
jgi:putative cofactor-binding repeat protein